MEASLGHLAASPACSLASLEHFPVPDTGDNCVKFEFTLLL